MKQHTKERVAAIVAQIQSQAFMAGKAKSPREHLNRIQTLSREACDYFALAVEAAPPAPEPNIAEPDEYGYSCVETGCDGSAETDEGYPTIGEALDAAARHREAHKNAVQGIVTFEREPVLS